MKHELAQQITLEFEQFAAQQCVPFRQFRNANMKAMHDYFRDMLVITLETYIAGHEVGKIDVPYPKNLWHLMLMRLGFPHKTKIVTFRAVDLYPSIDLKPHNRHRIHIMVHDPKGGLPCGS